MENASKALLIAGGVLLAIMVLTIAIYLKGKFDNVADQYVASQDVAEIQKYNAKFEPYIGKEDITPQDLVTLIEFARTNGNMTEINIASVNYTIKNDYSSSTFIEEKSSDIYECSSIEYYDEGKVKRINFVKKN